MSIGVVLFGLLVAFVTFMFGMLIGIGCGSSEYRTGVLEFIVKEKLNVPVKLIEYLTKE